MPARNSQSGTEVLFQSQLGEARVSQVTVEVLAGLGVAANIGSINFGSLAIVKLPESFGDYNQ